MCEPALTCRHRKAVIPHLQKELLLRCRQPPISMGFGARLSGTKFTLLSGLGATSWAPNRQGLFLGDSHGYIMRVYSMARWSILTVSNCWHRIGIANRYGVSARVYSNTKSGVRSLLHQVHYFQLSAIRNQSGQQIGTEESACGT
jgi:hypothetical protein